MFSQTFSQVFLFSLTKTNRMSSDLIDIKISLDSQPNLPLFMVKRRQWVISRLVWRPRAPKCARSFLDLNIFTSHLVQSLFAYIFQSLSTTFHGWLEQTVVSLNGTSMVTLFTLFSKGEVKTQLRQSCARKLWKVLSESPAAVWGVSSGYLVML